MSETLDIPELPFETLDGRLQNLALFALHP